MMRHNLQLGLTFRGFANALLVAVVAIGIFGLVWWSWDEIGGVLRAIGVCGGIGFSIATLDLLQERLHVEPHLVRTRRFGVWREWRVGIPRCGIDYEGYYCITDDSTGRRVLRVTNVYRDYWEEIGRVIQGRFGTDESGHSGGQV